MKLFVTLFLVLVGLGAHALITDQGQSFQYDATGTLVRSDVVDIAVKCNATHSAGDVVIVNVTDDDGGSTSAGSTLGDPGHCVVVKSCVSGDTNVRCRVYGKISANHSAEGDNAVAGQPVYLSGDALTGKVTGITSPAATDHPVGVALDASSATESLEIFVKLLGV